MRIQARYGFVLAWSSSHSLCHLQRDLNADRMFPFVIFRLAMARKKQSLLEDVMEIAAHLPWKFGIGLAMLTYLLLHHFATREPMTMHPVALNGLGKSMSDSVLHGVGLMLASVMQYVLPLALLVGAAVSFLRQRRQGELHQRVANDPAHDALEKMSWREFEGLAAETFRRQGYRVIERGGDGPDGGVDLELSMGKDKYLVQCKQWKANKVGVATVRELYGVMTAERAVGGFVVASGNFTDDARAFAEGRSIRLVPAKELRRMIGQSGLEHSEKPSVKRDSVDTDTAPACPRCGQAMIQRVAKTGSKAGEKFWGCSTFPACRGVR